MEVLCFLDRYSWDAAKLANASGKELVNKHLSASPLRVLHSVTVESEASWSMSDAKGGESEHRATLAGMDVRHEKYANDLGLSLFNLYLSSLNAKLALFAHKNGANGWQGVYSLGQLQPKIKRSQYAINIFPIKLYYFIFTMRDHQNLSIFFRL